MHRTTPAWRALVAAVALTMALTGTTLASSQSSATAQTLAISTTLTLTGVPASVNYGTGLGGVTLAGPANAANVQVSSNNPSGVRLGLAFTDLARTGGGGTIVSTANQIRISAVAVASDCTGGATWGTNTMRAYPGPADSEWIMCSRATAGTINFPGTGKTWQYEVLLPAAPAPGTYTGTATWTATEF